MKKDRSLGWPFAVAALVFIAWLAWPFLLARMPWNGGRALKTSVISDSGLTELGQLGDLFGGFNALFGALAFIGIVYTIFLQRSELNRTQRQMRDSEQATELQRFEATFFQLIETFNSIVATFEKHNVLTRGPIPVTLAGREVIADDIDEFIRILKRMRSTPTQEGLTTTVSSYDQFYHLHDMRLAHYFRMLYRILKWLDRAPKDKTFYAKTLRAQLSSQEVLLLMFNCLHPFGEKMKPLTENYGLLKHLPLDRGEFEVELAEFDPRAFGDPSEIPKDLGIL